MSEAPEAVAEPIAPAEIPAAETQQADPASEVAAEGSEAAAEAPAGQEAAAEEQKKPKSPVSQLQGRVGHLTKTLHEKDAELTAERQRRETLEALLQAQGKLPEGDGASASTAAPGRTPVPGTPEFQRLVRTEAERVASEQAFTRDCNAIYDAGVQKHGETFKEAVANLSALELMSPAIVQAAMATGEAAGVLNALGSDVDEAARIAALPPAAMGVELAKLAGTLSAPKEQRQISRAPAPITPVGGTSQTTNDVYDSSLSDAEYYRRRAASGAKYIKSPQ